MRIADLLERQRPVFSFEFFPPKTDEGQQTLRNTLEILKDDEPDYVSVTYGAGGTTRNRTVEITKTVKRDFGIEAMAHLSCVGEPTRAARRAPRGGRRGRHTERARSTGRPASRGDRVEAAPGRPLLLGRADPADSRALRLLRGRRVLPGGAPRRTGPRERPSLRAREGRGRGGLPDHPALLRQRGLLRLRGARRGPPGIDVPIVPGIMPITNYGQIHRFTEMCGATIPEDLERQLNGRADDPEAVAELGVAYATLQCSDLLARGAPGVHFYTLNRSPATRAILAALRAAHPWTRAKAAV